MGLLAKGVPSVEVGVVGVMLLEVGVGIGCSKCPEASNNAMRCLN